MQTLKSYLDELKDFDRCKSEIEETTYELKEGILNSYEYFLGYAENVRK